MTDNTLSNPLREGLDSLSDLAKQEYHQDLGELVAKVADDEESLQRFTRLIGVSLKQPFAKPLDIHPSMSATGAYRTWVLDDSTFVSDPVKSSWQYSLLDKLRSEEWIPKLREGFQPADVQNLAQNAMYERGFFWYLAKSAHEYICTNKALEGQLQAAVSEVQRHGGAAALVSRDTAVAAVASTAAAMLIKAIPWLTVAATPVLTGLVIVVCTIGVNGFCGWSADRLADPERVP